MTTTPTKTVFRHIRGMIAAEQTGQLADGELLERFAARREEAAFAALVRRHGPLVLGVCRRVLHNRHDAEDAFQAAFLALARHAGAVGRRGSVGGWLHRVAYRAAVRARARALKREEHERRAAQRTTADPLAELTGRELLALLDEELQRLPDVYREPLVLCYLEGRTRDEAAREFGCSLGTMKRRLERAREVLRARLTARGVALPAALLAGALAPEAGSGAVPAALTAAALRTALAPATVPAAVADLAAGALGGVGPAKFKAAAVLLLVVGAAVLSGGALVTQLASTPAAAAPAPVAAADEKEAAKPAEKPAPPAETKEMTISGRVLDPDGKPLAGADVTVCARQGVMLNSWQGWASYRNEVLGRAKSDKDGGYRLTVRRPDPLLNLRSVHVVAAAAGHGLTWKSLDPDAERAEAELKLSVVQRVAGRLVGIQGEGAAGVTVHVAKVTRQPEKGERWDNSALRPPPDLPVSATTDAQGNFVLGGFGPGLKLEFEIRDPRYERKDEWLVDTGDKKQCENLRLVLGAGRCVEGRVVYEDTGKPVANARLMFANPIVSAKTDGQGRFKVALFGPSDYGNGPVRDIGIHAFPHPGEPYLNAFVGVDFPRGVVHREAEVKLPRGVLVRGKVTEAGSGKPVAGAYVTHAGLRETYAVTGPDGTYQLGVPAGTGYLLVTHPSDEYVPQILGSLGGGGNNPGGGSAEKPAGDRCYFHAIVSVTAKAGEDGKEVNVSLRRGVTVKGSVVGPDDKPVAHAVLLVSAPYKPRGENTMHPVDVWNGRLELRGLDPEKTYRLLVLDHPRKVDPAMGVEEIESFGELWLKPLIGPENKHGATVEVLPKDVKGELTVKLAPCGSAKVRFVDGDGKPLVKYSPWLQLVVTPGPTIHEALRDKVLAAEIATLIDRYGDRTPGAPKTDDKGYITFEGLIPGATYRLKKTMHEPENEIIKEFTAEAGKTLEVTVPVK
jgi:RNA polymerase sigma factor (sigma-70 family)